MNLISLSNGPLAEALLTNRFRAFRFSAGPWRRSGSFPAINGMLAQARTQAGVAIWRASPK